MDSIVNSYLDSAKLYGNHASYMASRYKTIFLQKEASVVPFAKLFSETALKLKKIGGVYTVQVLHERIAAQTVFFVK